MKANFKRKCSTHWTDDWVKFSSLEEVYEQILSLYNRTPHQYEEDLRYLADKIAEKELLLYDKGQGHT